MLVNFLRMRHNRPRRRRQPPPGGGLMRTETFAGRRGPRPGDACAQVCLALGGVARSSGGFTWRRCKRSPGTRRPGTARPTRATSRRATGDRRGLGPKGCGSWLRDCNARLPNLRRRSELRTPRRPRSSTTQKAPRTPRQKPAVWSTIERSLPQRTRGRPRPLAATRGRSSRCAPRRRIPVPHERSKAPKTRGTQWHSATLEMTSAADR